MLKCSLWKHLISENRILTMDLSKKNLSPKIKKHHLHKFHLKMLARQIMCFVHFFTLIVGDLIPEHDGIWQIF